MEGFGTKQVFLGGWTTLDHGTRPRNLSEDSQSERKENSDTEITTQIMFYIVDQSKENNGAATVLKTKQHCSGHFL
ncbi:hypothetical protein VNO78_20282 [Psophocarpus tetragonolobus]|uniref:Uncharacterized protein n=1 Tax=Psophocarpus tetragonolobus TaxID=3891 RepID=A0AAN9S908_PSOTE